MHTIHFDDKHIVEVPEGSTVLEAARDAGLVLESPCNGAGVCGKCKVRIEANDLRNVRFPENASLPRTDRAQGFVLSCETRVFGNVKVFMPRQEGGGLKILEEGLVFEIARNPNIRKLYNAEKNATQVFGGETLLCEEAGDTSAEAYGLSMDIGTTTLVLALVDLNTGRQLGVISAMNPQAVYAQDVVSRIQFASEPDGLQTLHRALAEEINRMASALAERHAVSTSRVYEAVYSGNTCMLHLAAGISPEPLGKYPYTPVLDGARSLKAADLGLRLAEAARVYLPPCISAYVGADISSGILAASLFDRKGITLFVDIGTNGEMVIASDGCLHASSAAAGPAFEGMNIAMGMRAGAGAVERFAIEDGAIAVKVIGDAEPAGLCGSGLIDAVGELVAAGVIDPTGRFAAPDELPPFLAERLTEYNGKPAFRIAGDVLLSQKDVRQVQLAKGAVRTGIEYLLRAVGTAAEDVEKVWIAGSFGYHLRAKNLIRIGLLPQAFRGKTEFAGNTSASGGRAFLLGMQYREEMERRAGEVEVLELSGMDDFEQSFIQSLNFEPAEI
ncbi:MAG: ASKHA domain-containing protein [Clostridiales Family XIII bacterium]|jgi:uncharacterized 2Fe-2S/4Fe-4S cluster protein (DUF4445 family)|nr:ASKHA domain-containing protein [Clostridiales Family XIII bacterium]